MCTCVGVRVYVCVCVGWGLRKDTSRDRKGGMIAWEEVVEKELNLPSGKKHGVATICKKINQLW